MPESSEDEYPELPGPAGKRSKKERQALLQAELQELGEQPQRSFDHKPFLKQLTERPGVYQMLDEQGNVLYVGKAKNLKKRVSSYFRARGLNTKTVVLVSKIHSIQVTVTNSETEALLLEQNLIKQHRPTYNILLLDDKSYPYIFLSDKAEHPRLVLHRGAKREKGAYFGPYPSASAARDSLQFLQKVFRVRQCEDSVFNNRSRPCLQYQIKRCSGPCVDMVSKADYQEAVRHTAMFLAGKSQSLMQELADDMEAAAAALDFEKAAELRDQIVFLQQVREKQYIEGVNGDLDVIAADFQSGSSCVHVLFVRGGRILGSRSYFPRTRLQENAAQVLEDFVGQYYLGNVQRETPAEIVVSEGLAEAELLGNALSEHAGRRVVLTHRVRANKLQWLQLARATAEQNLKAHLGSRQTMQRRFELLQQSLDLDALPERLECFDISHSGGELTVASCVVFDREGPRKSDYRRFNIDGITPGDDYAAMGQALTRRYRRLQENEGLLPDILFIDGGVGQLNRAQAVLDELGIQGLLLIGVTKGEGRKAAFDSLRIAGRKVVLPADSGALHLVQQIRDEAHRFAIGGHKQRRDKKRQTSSLEGIPGVGAARRRELLRHFGGIQGIARASVQELASVPKISKKVAEDIYAVLHNE